MLTYQDVIAANLKPLTTAAVAWDGMADGFEDLGEAYRGSVESATTDGGWVGISSDAAKGQFTATRQQFEAAAVEARAIAAILRDIHGQFTDRIRAVRDVVASAKEADMHIDANGRAHLDPSKPKDMFGGIFGEANTRQMLEASWTGAVAAAVQAVDDADQGAKLALRDAAGIKSLFQEMFDNARGAGHSFNADAVGDIEVVEAREAKKYADEILAGEKPSDLAEYERLMRDNSGDIAFSRTLLNSLGPENTLKLSNSLNDLAYFDDTKGKQSYLTASSGLATSLATATRVPEFMGPTDSKGVRKPLRYGTPEYTAVFQDWKGTTDASFYNKWVADLDKYGDDKYDLKVAGEKIQIGNGQDQQVRGYQSLVTLMQQGEGYSPNFVADITDNMIAAERKDPDIWDLRGSFGGEEDGWFANDPVDGALGVMARNPEGATSFLDPGTTEGKERYNYLLGTGEGARDWEVVDTREYRKVETTGPDIEDAETRAGVGAALTAAATGVDPSNPHGSFVEHTAENDRVFQYSLEYLSKQGDDVHASLRDDLAMIMINHGDEVHATMGDQSGERAPLDQVQVMEVTKQISRSQDSYGILHEGMNYAIVESFHDESRKPEDTLNSAGYTIGFMEEARYNALQDGVRDLTWEKSWSYHAPGSVANFVPVVGDIAQRGIDMVTTKWMMDEAARMDARLTLDNQDTYLGRRSQLNALADEWYSVNSEWADKETGYSREQGVKDKVGAAANDGNLFADGISGDQS